MKTMTPATPSTTTTSTKKTRTVLLGLQGNPQTATKLGKRAAAAYESLRPDEGIHVRWALPPVSGSTGGNFAKMLGMSPKKFDEAFDRLNFVENLTYITGDILRARRVTMAKLLAGRRVVALGGMVTNAFGAPMFTPIEVDGLVMLGIPHPSGLNRVYNEEAIREKMKKSVLEFIR